MTSSHAAEVAQSVEQGTENPRVGSSILSLGTRNFKGASPKAGPFFVETVSPTPDKRMPRPSPLPSLIFIKKTRRREQGQGP